MKIQVSRLPEEGLHVDFSEKDCWIIEKLSFSLGDLFDPTDKLEGYFDLKTFDLKAQVKGKISLMLHPNCSRCLKAISSKQEITFENFYNPLFESKRQAAIEEALDVEVTKEDVDFSYYEGDEIDVGDFIAEQVLLAQDMTILCKEDCKGLCSQCGQDLNEQSCNCTQKVFSKASPFAVLKDLKLSAKTKKK